MVSDAFLSLRGLRKCYQVRSGRLGLEKKTLMALDGVDLSIPRGGSCGLVGESGSGKSTLARAVMRLLSLDGGEIRFDGVDLLQLRGSELRRMRRRLQMVFQDPFASLNPRMRVGDIVEEGLVIHRLGNASQRRAAVREMLARVGLGDDALDRYPHQFSGGQRQRIGIARALVLKPDLLVCDEPVSALDVSIQAQILTLLQSLREELNLTLLFISHDLRVVRHMCEQVAVMRSGRIVEQGPVEQVYAHPQSEYTRTLLSAVVPHARLAPESGQGAGQPGARGI
ncbi:ATP-binding cassette domain-containing protein [Thermithiobacillus tepidarius DSM 3134]|uniref:ATP-binding cassette domain-containing protein n=1 Tax=Thermithiobacillus tepidarius TaxID=929 RepID=UPI0004267203|nr:ATP-binding cassette domain-containing protein [Thermithiobacillus tepidarius]